MKFRDDISFGEARAYVNKWEAWYREDYMKSGFYKDLTFDEYLKNINCAYDHLYGMKEALKELMNTQEVSA